MKIQPNLENCLAFVNCQLQPATRLAYLEKNAFQPRAVTISRQAGCGALVVANKLAEILQQRGPADAPSWTVFDRNLMDKVLEDHNLPKWFAKFLPEDRLSELQDIIDELFGLHPPSWTVVEQTAETILQLADLGKCNSYRPRGECYYGQAAGGIPRAAGCAAGKACRARAQVL